MRPLSVRGLPVPPTSGVCTPDLGGLYPRPRGYGKSRYAQGPHVTYKKILVFNVFKISAKILIISWILNTGPRSCIFFWGGGSNYLAPALPLTNGVHLPKTMMQTPHVWSDVQNLHICLLNFTECAMHIIMQVLSSFIVTPKQHNTKKVQHANFNQRFCAHQLELAPHSERPVERLPRRLTHDVCLF